VALVLIAYPDYCKDESEHDMRGWHHSF